MKIQKFKKKSKLLKLYIVKTKIYKKRIENIVTIEELSVLLKKVFQIIYKYHFNNKLILFLVNPFFLLNNDSLVNFILQKTRHKILCNNKYITYTKKNKHFNVHKINLIVIVDDNLLSIKNNIFDKKIPIIKLGFCSTVVNNIFCNVPFSDKNFLFSSILKSVLIKSSKLKSVTKYILPKNVEKKKPYIQKFNKIERKRAKS